MLEALVSITLKPTVVDPQGLAVKGGLKDLGFKEVEDVRVGKLVKVTLKSTDPKKAEAELENMCSKLLANPVIEDYSYEIKELSS